VLPSSVYAAILMYLYIVLIMR